MTRRLFGTDGIRGTANSEPMTPETALKVAMAVGESFHNGAHKHLVVIGKDTRLSGYMLEPALTAGFVTMGLDVVLVGPLPTPAIAMLTRSLRADIGVVLSASHNPYRDNGIKLFGRDGYKLSDELELKIEDHLAKGLLEYETLSAEEIRRIIRGERIVRETSSGPAPDEARPGRRSSVPPSGRPAGLEPEPQPGA